ncbi:MAG: BatA and WFA domain-containing protein [Fuerstiella sp.]
MTFTNPIAFFAAILVIPVVVLYLLRTRLRRVPVSTVMFWQQVFEEKQSQLSWHRLRNLLSLLTQLLFLTLVILALADPVSEADLRQHRRIIAVLDVSASMQAADRNKGSRIDLAKQRIRQLIDSMKPQDEMALITAGSRAQVICGLTSHQRTLARRLDSVVVTDETTGLREAVDVARRLLADHADTEIVVLTDGCVKDAADIAAAHDLVWFEVGTPSPNIGITLFQARSNPQDPTGYQVLLEVRNFSDAAAECSLDFKLNNQLQDVIPLRLAAEETLTQVFEKTSLSGGVLTATLVSEQRGTSNSLAVDDTAVAILPPRPRIPVTLVTDGQWFLQRALEANPMVDLTVTDSAPDAVPSNAILILHRRPLNRIPPGRVLVVQPAANTQLWNLQGPVQDPLVGWQDDNSDLLRNVRLDNVLMPEAVAIQPVAEHQKLVESVAGVPLYLEFPRDSGSVLVLPVSLDQGDLPLRTAFPIMLSNALTYLTGSQEDLPAALSSGEVATLSLNDDWQTLAARHGGRLALTAPDGQMHQLTTSGAEVRLGPLPMCGLWTLSALPETDSQPESATPEVAGPVRQIACNLSSPAESDLRRPAEIEAARTTLPDSSGRHPIWFYVVLAALVLLTAEWFLFQRRWLC